MTTTQETATATETHVEPTGTQKVVDNKIFQHLMADFGIANDQRGVLAHFLDEFINEQLKVRMAAYNEGTKAGMEHLHNTIAELRAQVKPPVGADQALAAQILRENDEGGIIAENTIPYLIAITAIMKAMELNVKAPVVEKVEKVEKVESLETPSNPRYMSTEMTPTEQPLFEAYCKSKAVSVDKDLDAWGREKYMHSHVDAMANGWMARANLASQASVSEVSPNAELVSELRQKVASLEGDLALLPAAPDLIVTELRLLEEVCAAYADDEDRQIALGGEGYGSVPVPAGMKARQARSRYQARVAAEKASGACVEG